jgi:hypothetical protein
MDFIISSHLMKSPSFVNCIHLDVHSFFMFDIWTVGLASNFNCTTCEIRYKSYGLRKQNVNTSAQYSSTSLLV